MDRGLVVLGGKFVGGDEGPIIETEMDSGGVGMQVLTV